MQDGIHDGHRERLLNKFLEFPDSFSDHELLEIFLFSVLPRVDTNAVAHRLINSFGSLAEIFSASAEQLKTVKGVGEKTAAQIILLGKLLERVNRLKKSDATALRSPETVKNEVIKLFSGLKSERLYFFLLDDKFNRVFTIESQNGAEDSVFADVSEIARAVSVHKARFALIAHNHPSGDFTPSPQDDAATKKLHILCEMHGVKLIDHVIVCGDKVYSYFSEGRLAALKDAANIDKLVSMP